MLKLAIAHQAVLLIIRQVASKIVLEEQYLFDHLGDYMVLKRIIFVLQMQFAEVLNSFLVIIKSFSRNKFLRSLEV